VNSRGSIRAALEKWIPDRVRNDEGLKTTEARHFWHRHPELVSGSMVRRFLRRGAGCKARPWMLKQRGHRRSQHDELVATAPHPIYVVRRRFEHDGRKRPVADMEFLPVA
jgi:hypothetical protein